MLAAAFLWSAFASGPALARATTEVAPRLDRFRACPVVGSQWVLDVRPDPSGSGYPQSLWVAIGPDSPSWDPSPPGLEAVLADSASWVAPASARDRHLRLRERLNREMPDGAPQVLVFESSNHWTSVEKSVVATRGADAVWRVSSVREINVGSGGDEESTFSETELSATEGARLDAYLADPCLMAEPVNTDYSSIWTSTQTRWTLEVTGTPSPLIVAGGHAGFGRTGKIAGLVAGSF